MRIATYNVEWFDALFDAEANLLDDAGPSGRQGVTRHRQIAALGIVLRAIDADAIMVIEAPDDSATRSCVAALEGFAAQMQLRTTRAISGFRSDTQQEIALLYDPAVLVPRHDPQGARTGKKGSADAPRFDSVFRWDLDADGAPELIVFSKPPLELAVQSKAGRSFRMIGVHAKSKAPHGADTPQALMRMAIENRRKQLAQCLWLRQRVAMHLQAGESLIVLGDFNDGPGLDEYEDLFGRSGVEIVLGPADSPPALRLHDPHAEMALSGRIADVPATARFIRGDGRGPLSVAIDYIMISDDLRRRAPRWRVWHPLDDPGCAGLPELRRALLQASDHFPVTLDIAL